MNIAIYFQFSYLSGVRQHSAAIFNSTWLVVFSRVVQRMQMKKKPTGIIACVVGAIATLLGLSGSA
jgi:hypothetical protein